MNVRRGIKRILIALVIVAELFLFGIFWVVLNDNNPTVSDDMRRLIDVLMVVAIAIVPVIAYALWIVGNWIVNGFRNSN